MMNEKTKERCRKLIEEAVSDGITAGVTMLVRRRKEEVFYTEYGFQNLEEKKPIKRNSIFRLYSMSKPITGAAAMILMEQGKLDLAQPVAEILP